VYDASELRLYFLIPEEFTNPAVIERPEERKWVEELLDRVRQGYEIVMDSLPGWLRQILERAPIHSTLTPPPSGSVGFTDPSRLRIALPLGGVGTGTVSLG
jgi:hypothetical protein